MGVLDKITKPQAAENDDENYGPAMSALSAKERAFVLSRMSGQNFANAARQAGYGKPDSSAETMASIGYRVSHYPRVVEALMEEAKKSIRALAPQAVSTVHEAMSTFDPKARLKAAEMVLSRTDAVVQKQDVNVKHEVVDHRHEALIQLKTLKALGVTRDKLEELFGFTGLPMLERQLEQQEASEKPAIDAEYRELKQE